MKKSYFPIFLVEVNSAKKMVYLCENFHKGDPNNKPNGREECSFVVASNSGNEETRLPRCSIWTKQWELYSCKFQEILRRLPPQNYLHGFVKIFTNLVSMMNKTAEKNILVLGIGNLLLKDEGVGVQVISKMVEMDLPENVEVMDGATAPLDILYLANDVGKLIIVDAVKAGSAPGTIYRISPDDVETCIQVPLSLHHLDLVQMLELCDRIGSRPSTVIIGVEPKEIDFELELSPEVAAKVPQIIELILREIGG